MDSRGRTRARPCLCSKLIEHSVIVVRTLQIKSLDISKEASPLLSKTLKPPLFSQLWALMEESLYWGIPALLWCLMYMLNHLLLYLLVRQRHKKHLRERDMWCMKCLMLCNLLQGVCFIVRQGLRVLNIPRTTWRQCWWLTEKVWHVELTSKWMVVLRSVPSLGEELKLTGLSLITVDFFF